MTNITNESEMNDFDSHFYCFHDAHAHLCGSPLWLCVERSLSSAVYLCSVVHPFSTSTAVLIIRMAVAIPVRVAVDAT